MGVRFASMGSGSKGNGTLVADETVCLLIDLGFTIKESRRRLARLDLEPEDVDAILVTHEHADHAHGVAAFARKFQKPVYLTPGTGQPGLARELPEVHLIDCHRPFTLGSFKIMPVAVPHDAREPCQYVLNSGEYSIGVLTDLGHVTPHIRRAYRDCDALLLEFNHDLAMLEQGPYPQRLKQRVGGDYGHLNNAQAADLVSSLDLTRLRHLVVSHISAQNNLPELALESLQPLLADWSGNLLIASQTDGLDWLALN